MLAAHTRRFALLLLALSSMLRSLAVFAQAPEQMATRRDLLAAADQASQSGDHARALDLAQRAGQIQMTPSVRMFIASEESQLGRIAAALGDSDLCIHEVERDATMRNREAVMARCREIAATLGPRAGRITIHVPSPLPAGLRVEVAGAVLDPALYGVPSVVTPGPVTVDARAPGRATYHTTENVPAGAMRDVTLQMPVTRGSSEPSLAASNTDRAASASSAAHGMSPIAIVGLGAAIVGVVAGGVGAYLYFGDVGNTYNHCVMTGCTGSQVSAGQTEQAVALSMMYGGGALMVGGAVLFLVFRNSGSGERRPAVQSLWIDPRGSVGVSGRF